MPLSRKYLAFVFAVGAVLATAANAQPAQDEWAELFGGEAYIEAFNYGFDFGLLCNATENYKSDAVVFIAYPKKTFVIPIPYFASGKASVEDVDGSKVIVAVRSPSYVENYVASFAIDKFMFKVGWRNSITSDDYVIQDWYIDRTTGGLGSFTESNATNDPQMVCRKLEPSELLDRLEEFARVQVSVAMKQRDAAAALDQEKQSKLKF